MHDLRLIRDDPVAFGAALLRRGVAIDHLAALDQAHRQAQTEAQAIVAERNALAKQIGQAMALHRLDDAAALKKRVQDLKAIPDHSETTKHALDTVWAALPNLPALDVPDGPDDTYNVVVHERGTKPVFDFAPREHFEFGPALGLDFEAAQAVAGARFAYLRGPVARLNRALGQYMLDVHTTEFGYQEVAPPLLVRPEAAFGTGQLPKLADDMFATQDGRLLIPTSEVSLTNLVRDRILMTEALPQRFVALTPCFRLEAGSAGRDTRGLIRQHQFDKVELVSVVNPGDAAAEHERMTHAAETILDRLGLRYRRMLLCTGDMGFSARKTYDLEVWLPGQDRYREISSCSDCGDFQARRMAARFRTPGKSGTDFVHTLNGSGVAVGRALVAVLETYQRADGSVKVPDILLSYMGGLTELRS